MRKIKIFWEYLIFVIFLVVLASCIPFELTVAPNREFIVVDTDRKPIVALARQYWHQYALNYADADDQISDVNGNVKFPKRVIKTSLISLVWGGMSNIFQYTINAGISSTDSIGVFAEGYERQIFFDGIGLESGVVRLKKEKSEK